MATLRTPGCAIKEATKPPAFPLFYKVALLPGIPVPVFIKKIVRLNLYTPSISFIFSCIISLPYLVDLLSRLSAIAPKHLLSHKTFPRLLLLTRFPLIPANRSVLKTVLKLPPLNFLGCNFH